MYLMVAMVDRRGLGDPRGCTSLNFNPPFPSFLCAASLRFHVSLTFETGSLLVGAVHSFASLLRREEDCAEKNAMPSNDPK